MTALDRDELQRFLDTEFPQTTVRVESVGNDFARVRQEIGEAHLRPGGTVSGPVMMSVADTATYAALLAQIGRVPLAVTTNLNIHFLRKPAPDCAIVAEANLIKRGKRLVVAEVRIYSEGHPALVAHASVTYSIPPGS